MPRIYANKLKHNLCVRICVNRESTSLTANEQQIPLRTIEKWVTAFNKNSNCFDNESDDIPMAKEDDKISYESLSRKQLISTLKRQDKMICSLKSKIHVNDFENKLVD